MKKWLLASGVMAVCLLGVFVVHASAMGLYVASENGDAVIEASKTVDSSAYLAGNNVIIDGTVNGDVYCAGRDVKVSGTVNGDVICAGQNVTVTGTVNGDVRLAGATVTLSGKVSGRAAIAGSSVTSLADFSVGSDMTAMGATVSLSGSYGRDVTVGGDSVTVDGKIGRDISGSMTKLVLDPKAHVAGNLSYQAENETSVPAGIVAGSVNYTKMQDSSSQTGATAQSILWAVAIFVFFAVVVTFVMPKFVHEAAMVPGRTVLIAFLAGLATLILLPIVAIILCSLVVGVMVGIALLIAWLLMIVLSGVFVSYYIGTIVLRKRAKNAIVVAAVGALVLGIAAIIPIVNILIVIVAPCIGVGMQILQFRHQFDKHPYKITA